MTHHHRRRARWMLLMLVGLLLAAAPVALANQAASSSPLKPVSGTTGPLPGGDISDAPPHLLEAAPVAEPAAYPPDPWRLHATIPTGGRYLVAGTTVDNDNLDIFGGSTGTTYLDEVWHYDRASATWTAKAPLPEPMGNLSVAYNPRDGMIYVAGGWQDVYYSNALHRYDPASDTWETLAPLPTAKSGAAIGIVDNVLYLFGGNGGGSFNDTQVYDIATNTWFVGPAMPVSQHSYGGQVTYRGSIYVLSSFSVNHMLRYDTRTQTWEQGPNMLATRNSPSCVISRDGVISCWGGGDSWTGRSDGESYDLADWPNGSWQPIEGQPMPTPAIRAGHACLGKHLWVAGGAGQSSLYLDVNQSWYGGFVCHWGEPSAFLPMVTR